MRKRWLTRLGVASAAAGLAVLGVTGPAWADGNIPINPGNVPTTAAEFEDPETRDADCKDILDAFLEAATGPEQMDATDDGVVSIDGWHFILPGNDNDFTEIHLTFTRGDGTEIDVTIPGETDEYIGWLAETGAGQVKHGYLLTLAGWTLTGGDADVTGEVGETDQFNLSHTCANIIEVPESPSPSPSPSTPGTPSTPGEPSESGSTPGGGGGGGELPLTGVAVGGIALAGTLFVAGGVALVMLRRRRDTFVA